MKTMNKSLPLAGYILLTLSTATCSSSLQAQQKKFTVEEASITDIQKGIQSGATTCVGVVKTYIERAKAYNGVCTALLTKDGAPVNPAKGMMRAGSLLEYPTKTVAASTVFPDLDQYEGLPLDLGKMITSISDPDVKLQYGMRVGIPNAGQVDALETLNIRGERSITCKGDFDKAPSAGPLPPGAPAVCEEFRKQPDALERAAELDKEYGKNPDLKKMPMYCAVFSLKNWYDAKDIRGTGGYDVNFAFDVPKYDSPDVATLRSKGAIIYAIATANDTTMASAPGPKKATTVVPTGDLQYGEWGGQACNPYDTARVARGTSNGSGVSVSTNMATCSICEQTYASCKGPASRNGIALLLTTKGVMGDGGITSTNSGDRAGIHCKTIKDAALVLDSIKGYKPEDMFSALPKGIIPEKPYVSDLVPDSAVKDKPLKGVRIAMVREFMVKHTKNDVAISDQEDKEMKEVLRDKLGADLVETVDPLYADDPTVPNMKYSFQDAMAEVLPHLVPEFFFKKDKNGELEYAVPGWDVTSMDYDIALQLHKAPLSDKINIRSIASAGYTNPSMLLDTNEYLAKRGDTRVKDWASWVANGNFKSEQEKVAAENGVLIKDQRPAAGMIGYLEMQQVMRMIVLKVMQENKIDVFVNPEITLPPYLLGGAPEPEVLSRASASCCQIMTALIGAPEADVPAGFVTTVYNPKYELSADKKTYNPVTGTVESKLEHPMPISMMFWSGPGYDADVIKVASAYESATHHRTPPPAFGPLASEK